MRAIAVAAQQVWLVVLVAGGCTSPRSAFDRAEVSSSRSTDPKSRDAAADAAARDAGEADGSKIGTSGFDSPDAGDAAQSEPGDVRGPTGDEVVCGDGKVTGEERCDTKISAGQPGACPVRCGMSDDACESSRLVGAGCGAHCASMPITVRTSGDMCCPSGANAANDRDCTPVCGNSVTEPGETCDPPDSCPMCPASSACLRVSATGTPEECNRVCETTAITACAAKDGCCPSGCTPQNDSDCSARCGDGVVDSSVGETCEPSTATPCPQDCADGDSCTQDVRSGSDANCNVTCTHVAISEVVGGDGCCRPGSNASADSDCPAVCGNGVVEPGEDCDDANPLAGDGCTALCKRETATQMCVAGRENDACAQCTCSTCRSAAAGCRPEDGDDGSLCSELASCMRSAGCNGLDCYCNDILGCVAGVADGKCHELIEEAIGSTNALEIILFLTLTDPGSVIGRAMSLTLCQRNSCNDECPR